MVADFAALRDDPAQQFGVFQPVFADDEEGRRNLLLLEDVEDLGGIVGVGAIIEGQGDEARVVRPATLDFEGRGQLGVARLGDGAIGGIVQRALAARGCSASVPSAAGTSRSSAAAAAGSCRA